MVKIKKGKGIKKEKIKDRGEVVKPKQSREQELWEPLRDTMDEMFRHFFRHKCWRGLGQLGSAAWKPEVDVHETKDDILVSTALPGMDSDDVEIEVTENSISIKGERKREEEVKEEDYYLCEQSYGSFSRHFTLPKEINVNKVEATFEQGILKVKLPKKERSRAKSVKIKDR